MQRGLLHGLLHVTPHLGIVHAGSLVLLSGLSLLPLGHHPCDLGAAGTQNTQSHTRQDMYTFKDRYNCAMSIQCINKFCWSTKRK